MLVGGHEPLLTSENSERFFDSGVLLLAGVEEDIDVNLVPQLRFRRQTPLVIHVRTFCFSCTRCAFLLVQTKESMSLKQMREVLQSIDLML